MPFCASAPTVVLTNALPTPLGGAVPGLLLRHALMAGHTERADVGQRALATPLHDWHDVVGIPIGAAAKEPPIALAELGPVSPLLLGPRTLDPVPFRVEGDAELGGIDATEGTHAAVTAKDALPHQCRAVSARPVIDACLATEGPAPLRNLGAAVPAQGTTIWSPGKLLSPHPYVSGADPAGTHGGSTRISVFMMGVLVVASWNELVRCAR